MNKKKIFLNFMICIAILGAGIGTMAFLIKNKKIPKQNTPEYKGILVKTVSIKKSNYRTRIQLTGIVKNFDMVNISSEVTGKIKQINPKVDKGASISKGDLLFTIDPFNYKIAVEMAKSSYAKEKSDMEQILSQAENAKKEWKSFHGTKEPPNKLVYMIPQLDAAKANLNAKKAELRKARNDFDKTKVYAPCDGIISTENVSYDFYVNPGVTLVKIIPSERRDIIVPVPNEDLAFLIDDQGGFITREASILLSDIGQKYDAQILRLLPEVDSKSIMYKMLIRVNKFNKNIRFLSDNIFVHVNIAGKMVSDVAKIPLEALRGKNKIWIMDKTSKLKIKKVILIEITGEMAVVRGAISDGERLIISHVNGAVDGMKLREL